jgi:membrane protein involved in colicin uptake
MKPVSFVIIAILLGVILFSIFKYASNTAIFENMSQGRFMIVSAIVNDDSLSTSSLESYSNWFI